MRVRSDQRRWPWRTALLLGTMATLLVQGYYSFSTRPEPYPTVRMPGFGYAADADGTMPVTMPSAFVETAGQERHELKPIALMGPLRYSVAMPTFTYVFDAQNDHVDEGVKRWLRARILELTDIDDPSAFVACLAPGKVDLLDAALDLDDPECLRVPL